MSETYDECGPKLESVGTPRPTTRFTACFGPTRLLNRICARSRLAPSGVKVPSNQSAVLSSIDQPPKMCASSIRLSRENWAPLSARADSEPLVGWVMSVPFAPKARPGIDGTQDGQTALGNAFLAASWPIGTVSCLMKSESMPGKR